MGDVSAETVRFDFDKALDLARKFWNLADKIDETQSARSSAAPIARQGWEGRFRDEFDQRMNQSNSDARRLSDAARKTARDFAAAWAHAADQKRMDDRAHLIEQKKANEAWYTHVGNFFFGDHTDDMPFPPNVDVPSPPDFTTNVNPHVPWTP
jgi:uncharacterized protein YukE